MVGIVEDPHYRGYVTNTLVVEPAPISIRALNQQKVYGEATPVLTAEVAGRPTDGEDIVYALSTVDARSGVGLYPIEVLVGGSVNYHVLPIPGELTIQRAPLTIAADSGLRVLGAEASPVTLSYQGWVQGDGPSALSALPMLDTSANDAGAEGLFTVSVGGAAADNYEITYAHGALTVTRGMRFVRRVESKDEPGWSAEAPSTKQLEYHWKLTQSTDASRPSRLEPGNAEEPGLLASYSGRVGELVSGEVRVPMPLGISDSKLVRLYDGFQVVSGRMIPGREITGEFVMGEAEVADGITTVSWQGQLPPTGAVVALVPLESGWRELWGWTADAAGTVHGMDGAPTEGLVLEDGVAGVVTVTWNQQVRAERRYRATITHRLLQP